jgi:hypothetical protein
MSHVCVPHTKICKTRRLCQCTVSCQRIPAQADKSNTAMPRCAQRWPCRQWPLEAPSAAHPRPEQGGEAVHCKTGTFYSNVLSNAGAVQAVLHGPWAKGGGGQWYTITFTLCMCTAYTTAYNAAYTSFRPQRWGRGASRSLGHARASAANQLRASMNFLYSAAARVLAEMHAASSDRAETLLSARPARRRQASAVARQAGGAAPRGRPCTVARYTLETNSRLLSGRMGAW